METKWYTVKVQPNRERSVSERLKIEMNKNNISMNILIPMERLFFAKNGKKAFKEKVMYPGYIFIESNNMPVLQDLLRSAPGNSGIVRNKDGNPAFLREDEIKKMMEVNTEEVMELSETYVIGEEISIIGGPFNGFKGIIEEYSKDKPKMRVSVPIFGRPTKVDLTVEQVNKIID